MELVTPPSASTNALKGARSREAWLAGLALLGTVTALGAASPAHAQVLKVLQFNMNDEIILEDKDYRFRDRRFEALTKWIKANDVDVVFFQEGGNFHKFGSVIKAIAEAVGYDYNYRIGMGFPLVMYDSNGIIAKKKFHMSERRFAKLPHGAPWVGDGQHWIMVFGNSSWTVGNVLTLDDGSPLYAYTAHLNGTTQIDRDDQMWGIDQDVRAHVAQDGGDYEQAHILVAGDFNSDPATPGVHKMLFNGYVDTFDAVHPGNTACTNCADPTLAGFNPMTIAANEFPTQNTLGPNNRIDYVLTHGPDMQAVASTLVFENPINGIWMSDHFGLQSIINVGGPAVDASIYPNPLMDRADLGPLGQVVDISDAWLGCSHATQLQALLSRDDGSSSSFQFLPDVAGPALFAASDISQLTETPLEVNVASDPTLPAQAERAAPECEVPNLGTVSWERGVVFNNNSKVSVTIRVSPRRTGEGRVWSEEQVTLPTHGTSVAYFFDPGFEYRFGVKSSEGTVYGGLRSSTPSAR